MRGLFKVLLAIIITSQTAFGQIKFGDRLVKTGLKVAKKEAKNAASRELSNTKAKFDSTSFSYAISLNDKAAQFESKDKLADVVTVSSMFVDKDKSKTALEEAREMMDIGEMAYSANGFKLAEAYFTAANIILVSENSEAEPLYGRGLANLGLLYNNMGRYAAAKEFTSWALNIREKYRGHDSQDYAASLNNMAVLNKDLGNYNVAENPVFYYYIIF